MRISLLWLVRKCPTTERSAAAAALPNVAVCYAAGHRSSAAATRHTRNTRSDARAGRRATRRCRRIVLTRAGLTGGWVCSAFALAAALAAGCATRPPPPATGDLVLIVPGVAGDSSAYDALFEAAVDPSEGRSAGTFAWGAPGLFFMANFSDAAIHDAAERKLADWIERRRQVNPAGRIWLVGHSAGCGVILGALGRLRGWGEVTGGSSHDLQDGNPTPICGVILLAPSVSPDYDLAPAAAHVHGPIDVFTSEGDTLFLRWRTSHFGTYDRIKTPAAGFTGFNIPTTPSSNKVRVRQHAWSPADKSFGNDGGHFGAMARAFIRARVVPLLESAKTRPIYEQSPPVGVDGLGVNDLMPGPCR